MKKENTISELLQLIFPLPKKCELCGCYDGIHRSNCKFILSLDK